MAVSHAVPARGWEVTTVFPFITEHTVLNLQFYKLYISLVEDVCININSNPLYSFN
jgi:hypothetical protein